MLGKSCGVVLAGSASPVEESLVFCVPEELSLDNTTVVQTAVRNGSPYVTVKDLVQSLGLTHGDHRSLYYACTNVILT